MTVPSEQYILEVMGSLDPETCHEVRNDVRQKIGSKLEKIFMLFMIVSKNIDNDFSRKRIRERGLKILL